MINVIGLGYIGLPTALMLASHGVEVIGTDYNKELVHTLSNKLLKDGYKEVVLHVNSQNEPAISIYSKIGFEKIDETIKVKFI